jgi:hypothetical protein
MAMTESDGPKLTATHSYYVELKLVFFHYSCLLR